MCMWLWKNKLCVFVPYRGFYFLNSEQEAVITICKFMFSSPIGAFIFLIWNAMNVQKIKILFSSPIGAFIFLIRFTITWLQPDFNVFVPYRGFYFLNNVFSRTFISAMFNVFVPYRGFYFLNEKLKIFPNVGVPCFRPLSGLLFS